MGIRRPQIIRCVLSIAVGSSVALSVLYQVLQRQVGTSWGKWPALAVMTAPFSVLAWGLLFHFAFPRLAARSARSKLLWTGSVVLVSLVLAVSGIMPPAPVLRRHSVEIVATGKHNPATRHGTSQVWVYGLFDRGGKLVVPSTQFEREGQWRVLGGATGSIEQPGTLRWHGSLFDNSPLQLRLIKHPWSGIARVTIDGRTREVDLYSSHYDTKNWDTHVVDLSADGRLEWLRRAVLRAMDVAALAVLLVVVLYLLFLCGRVKELMNFSTALLVHRWTAAPLSWQVVVFVFLVPHILNYSGMMALTPTQSRALMYVGVIYAAIWTLLLLASRSAPLRAPFGWLDHICHVRCGRLSVRVGRLFLVVFAIGVGVRVLVAASTPVVFTDDTNTYVMGAAGLVDGKGFETMHQARTPGYPLILAGIRLLWGYPIDVPHQVVGHVFGALEVAFMYGIARLLTGSRWFSALVLMGCGTSLVHVIRANHVMTEASYTLLLTSGIFFSLLFVKGNHLAAWCVSVAMLMAATMIRPQGAMYLYLAYFLFVMVWLLRRTRWGVGDDATAAAAGPRPALAKTLAVFLLGLIVGLGPIGSWCYFNYAKHGTFSMTTFKGQALYQGVLWASNVVDYEHPRIMHIQERIAEYWDHCERIGRPLDPGYRGNKNIVRNSIIVARALTYSGKMSFPEASQFMQAAAVDCLKTDPWRFLRAWGDRCWAVMTATPYPNWFTEKMLLSFTNSLNDSGATVPGVRDIRNKNKRYKTLRPLIRFVSLGVRRENALNRAYSRFLMTAYLPLRESMRASGFFTILAYCAVAGALLALMLPRRRLWLTYLVYVALGTTVPYIFTFNAIRHWYDVEMYLWLVACIPCWLCWKALMALACWLSVSPGSQGDGQDGVLSGEELEAT